MSEYLILAENITFKNNKLSCINIYDKFTSVALPAEFRFDMAIICGPNWSAGEHNLVLTVKSSTGNEAKIGESIVNIPNEDFVYNAMAQDLKVVLDYSVDYLIFSVKDNGNEIISRKYQVVPILVPQNQENKEG